MSIGAIELQMLDQLRAGEAKLPWTWKTLATYPLDWDAFLAEGGQINSPGAWVGFAGTRSVVEGIGVLMIDAVFGVTVIAKNARGEQARRHGTDVAGEIGSYQMMIAALQLLVGWCPEGAVKGIEAGRVRHVRPVDQLIKMKASMMAAEVFVTFEAPLGLLDEGPDPFELFHANWDIPPFTPPPEIPADAQADATDHVELPQ